MAKLPATLRRDLGYSDVVRAMPKPTKAARWKKSIRGARLYADSWCREFVKAKYPRCVTCESAGQGTVALQWAHVLSGKGDAVKWDEQNMTRQCEVCNQLHEDHPEALTAWFVNTYGQPAFFNLVCRGNTTVKLTYSAIMKIGDGYRERCRKQKGEI